MNNADSMVSDTIKKMVQGGERRTAETRRIPKPYNRSIFVLFRFFFSSAVVGSYENTDRLKGA
jgi:hypothetical protein